MAVNVRCDNCGRLVEIDLEADGSTKTRCPGCKARMTVPEGLASLPTPKIPGAATASASAAGQPGGRPAAPPSGKPADSKDKGKDKEKASQEEEEHGPTKLSPMMAVLATAMPWLLSICLHAGALLILLFAVAVGQVVLQAPTPIPPAFDPNAEFSPEPPADEELKLGDVGAKVDAPDSASKIEKPMVLPEGKSKGWAAVDKGSDQIGKGWGISDKSGTMDAYGFGGGGGGGAGGTADFGLARGGGTGKVAFYGNTGGGNAYYVIYVIDHSGSVVGSFDEIRMQLKDSICRLVARQQFHVIFFSHDKYEEIQPKRLVFATEDNKRRALKALDGVQATGFGSSPIPALEVAFRAFRNTPDKRGKLCYILTDGEFDSSGYQYKGVGGKVLMGNEAVNAWLVANNKDRSVHMYPIILGPPPSAETEASMKKMAEDGKGRYKYVSNRE
jgi:hypothetical protein